MQPNWRDAEEWAAFCEWLEEQPRKSTYSAVHKNAYLIGNDPMMAKMRKWMRDNDCDVVFYSSGWGWRLRKNWRERLQRAVEM